MNKELEEAIKILNIATEKKGVHVYQDTLNKAIATVLQALENSIPKEVIKNKRYEYLKEAGSYDIDNATINQHKLIGGFEALNKLLEGK